MMSGKHSRRLSRAESARNSGTLGIAYHIVNMGSDQDDQRTDAINTVKKMALGATAVLISVTLQPSTMGGDQESHRTKAATCVPKTTISATEPKYIRTRRAKSGIIPRRLGYRRK